MNERFGLYFRFSVTGRIYDAHLGHSVVHRVEVIRQYDREADITFIRLDGMISRGFLDWVLDGEGGDGGWASSGGAFVG